MTVISSAYPWNDHENIKQNEYYLFYVLNSFGALTYTYKGATYYPHPIFQILNIFASHLTELILYAKIFTFQYQNKAFLPWGLVWMDIKKIL